MTKEEKKYIEFMKTSIKIISLRNRRKTLQQKMNTINKQMEDLEKQMEDLLCI